MPTAFPQLKWQNIFSKFIFKPPPPPQKKQLNIKWKIKIRSLQPHSLCRKQRKSKSEPNCPSCSCLRARPKHFFSFFFYYCFAFYYWPTHFRFFKKFFLIIALNIFCWIFSSSITGLNFCFNCLTSKGFRAIYQVQLKYHHIPKLFIIWQYNLIWYIFPKIFQNTHMRRVIWEYHTGLHTAWNLNYIFILFQLSLLLLLHIFTAIYTTYQPQYWRGWRRRCWWGRSRLSARCHTEGCPPITWSFFISIFIIVFVIVIFCCYYYC